MPKKSRGVRLSPPPPLCLLELSRLHQEVWQNAESSTDELNTINSMDSVVQSPISANPWLNL